MVIKLIYITLNLINIYLIECNNNKQINKEAPITCKMRINQPLFTLMIMKANESKAIVKKSL